jgi:flagellar biosynthesis protein FlhB
VYVPKRHVSEKTEAPTPRRLFLAREKGDVPTSAFASQSLGFLVAISVAPAAIGATAATATSLVRSALSNSPGDWSTFGLMCQSIALVVPILLATAATSAAATVIQTGALFAPTRLSPDLKRLDLIAGLRSLFDTHRLWAVGRAFLAAITVGYLAYREISERVADLARTVGRAQAAGALAGTMGLRLARDAALVAIALAVVDLLVQRRTFLHKLMMTKSEVRREHREREGDPQLKAARHRAYQDMLASAMVNAVRDATVVIVNPEHLATALRYLDGQDDAPVVVATGDGDLAHRIQDAARAYGIPIVRDVPVARALRDLEVGDTIPEALYEAVAEILREVWNAETTDDAAATPPHLPT